MDSRINIGPAPAPLEEAGIGEAIRTALDAANARVAEAHEEDLQIEKEAAVAERDAHALSCLTIRDSPLFLNVRVKPVETKTLFRSSVSP